MQIEELTDEMVASKAVVVLVKEEEIVIWVVLVVGVVSVNVVMLGVEVITGKVLRVEIVAVLWIGNVLGVMVVIEVVVPTGTVGVI